MASYRLSRAARQDLLDIAAHGDAVWGPRQSDRYRQVLKRHLQLLADEPMLFQAVEHIREGYRRSVCGSHSIYYRVGQDEVEIMRILGRQDPAAGLDV